MELKQHSKTVHHSLCVSQKLICNHNRWCWGLRFGPVNKWFDWSDSTGSSTNTDIFKSFKYKTKLIENTVAQSAPNAGDEIVRNATVYH